MAQVFKRTSSFGVGCLLQFLGLVVFLLALLTLTTVVWPIILVPLGLWLFVDGTAKATWYECSQCGTRLSHRKVVTCPACRSSLIP